MEKKFVRTGQLKPGMYVLIDGNICTVKGIEKSKPGKHGASKARVTGIGLFDDQKRQLLKPATDDSEVPIVERKTGQVVADMGENIQIIDTVSYQTYDVKKPKDVSALKSGDEVEYVKVDEQIRIVRKK